MAKSRTTSKIKEISKLDVLPDDPLRVIALMLWKNRHREPDMYVQITEQDIIGLDDCTRYLEVKPVVRIERPGGLPAQDAIPASRNRRAVPARSAMPPKPYVVVTLVDEQGNLIKPIENNEADYDTAQESTAIRAAKDKAPQLAQMIVRQASSGEISLSDIQDAANALVILARAV